MHLRPQFGLALISALVFGLLDSNAALAMTRWVNDPPNIYSPPGMSCTSPGYPTIGAAVTAAMPGDTIMVCAGLYAEQVQINKNKLTLLGAQAGIDSRTRPVAPGPSTPPITDHPC